MSDYYNHPLVGIMSRRRVKKIMEGIGDIKGKKILDVGCEAGYVSLKLAELGGKVYSLDIVKEAVFLLQKQIRSKNQQNIFAMIGSAHHINMQENSVDVIICTEVIEHMPKLEIVFREFKRVLKPGGQLIITFPNEAFRKILYPLISLFGINTEVESEVTLFAYSMNDIVTRCEEQFEVEKIYSIPWFFPLTRFIFCKNF